MWENTVEPDRLQMTVWRMRIAFWLPRAPNTHSQYVIIPAFPLQQWLHELPSILRYTYSTLAVLYSHMNISRTPDTQQRTVYHTASPVCCITRTVEYCRTIIVVLEDQTVRPAVG